MNAIIVVLALITYITLYRFFFFLHTNNMFLFLLNVVWLLKKLFIYPMHQDVDLSVYKITFMSRCAEDENLKRSLQQRKTKLCETMINKCVLLQS